MAELQPIGRLLQTFVMSVICGGMTLVGVVLAIFRIGPTKFFHYRERTERPGILDDPTLGKHQTIQLQDVKIHAVVNGDEGKPLMLFLHGFPEFWFSWRHQIRHFTNQYRTVAVDMRGYGESDKPSGVSEYFMDKLTDDVRQIIQALGYKKCVLVAHDWGGAVASRFTHTHPELVDKLVLLNIPHTKAFMEHIQTSFSQIKKSWYIFMFQWPYLSELYLRSNDFQAVNAMFTRRVRGSSRAPCTAEEAEAYKFSLSQPGGLTCPVNYYRAAMRYDMPEPEAPKITVPTLLIWGEQDMALEKEMAELTRKYHSDLSIKYIPTGSHWALMDEPEQVNEAMADYLTGKNKVAEPKL